MNSFIQNMQLHCACTHNGAVTHRTSTHPVLDLFFVAGAARTISEDQLRGMLDAAWSVDPLLTLKLIFWAGDIRGGAGERRFMRVALIWLETYHVEELITNMELIPEYGRWDSIMIFQTDRVRKYAATLCAKGLAEENGLCAKWMPRRKQYDNFAKTFREVTELSPKQYRQLIVRLSKTVEQDMCAKEFGAINYSHVPSVAMNKYRTAFYHNDEERFKSFIDAVTSGTDPEVKINASAIFPHDIYRAWLRDNPSRYSNNPAKDPAINAQWNAMPDFIGDSGERILPMCDVSESMNDMDGLAMKVSVALGVYCSQHNVGPYQDAILSFTDRPDLHVIKGTPAERFRQFHSHVRKGYNTNLQLAYDKILETAIRCSIPANEMPTMLLIISDMEFDDPQVGLGNLTNYEVTEQKFRAAGYTMPKMVFWNVHGRPGNVPVSSRCNDVALVSGCSPAIMKSVLSGKDFTPLGIMKETLLSERYAPVQLS